MLYIVIISYSAVYQLYLNETGGKKKKCVHKRTDLRIKTKSISGEKKKNHLLSSVRIMKGRHTKANLEASVPCLFLVCFISTL